MQLQLNEIAEAVPAGSEGVVFLPYMSGERSPVWNPYAKGVFYGLDFAKTKGHMVRACMEGVAFSLRHNLEVAEEAGAKAEVLRAMGGSANSLLWTQIKADVTGDLSPDIYGRNTTPSLPAGTASAISFSCSREDFPVSALRLLS